MVIPFQRIKTNDAELNRVQDSIARFTRFLEQNPILDGVLLEGVTLASGANDIAHKLGRQARGWFPVPLRSNITVYDASIDLPSLLHNSHIRITASGAGTINLWVF